MTVYLHPDMCWLRRAILMAILNHPFVKDAEVYYPNNNNDKKKVSIETGRLFGGIELIEPGLTLSVHPYHSSFNVAKGIPPSMLSTTTVQYVTEGYKNRGLTIGSSASNDITYQSCIRLMVQLYYRDGEYNTKLNLHGDVVNQRTITHDTQFGYTYQYTDMLPEDVVKLEDRTNKQVDSITTKVQMLPGEEILTQWLDIIKYAIRDLKVLLPYQDVRNIAVTHSDYPTTTWTSSSPNLIFHTAYHIIELDIFEQAPAPRFIFPPVQEINLNITQL